MNSIACDHRILQFDVTLAFVMIGYDIPVCFDNVHVELDPKQSVQLNEIYKNNHIENPFLDRNKSTTGK